MRILKYFSDSWHWHASLANRTRRERNGNSYTVRLRLTGFSVSLCMPICVCTYIYMCMPIAFPRPLVNAARETLRNRTCENRSNEKETLAKPRSLGHVIAMRPYRVINANRGTRTTLFELEILLKLSFLSFARDILQFYRKWLCRLRGT